MNAEIVVGCPHEEGIDFPLGGDCPLCPFWNGKQGPAARGRLLGINAWDEDEEEFDDDGDDGEEFDDEDEDFDEGEKDESGDDLPGQNQGWDAQFARVEVKSRT